MAHQLKQDMECSIKNGCSLVNQSSFMDSVAEKLKPRLEVSATDEESPCDVGLNSVLASLTQLSIGNLDGGNNPLLTTVPGFGWSNTQPDDNTSTFNPAAYQNFSMLGHGTVPGPGIGVNPEIPMIRSQPVLQRWSGQNIGYTQHGPQLPCANSSRTYQGWGGGGGSQMTWSVLARNGLGSRSGIQHGRSMSVQNVNLTGDGQTGRPLNYASGLSLSPLISKHCQERMIGQEENTAEKQNDVSLLGMNQQDSSISMMDTAWLDLMRLAANQDSNSKGAVLGGGGGGKTLDPNWAFNLLDGRMASKGVKLPVGFLDNSVSRGDSSVLDSFTARKLCFPNNNKTGLGSQPALNRIECYSRKVFVGGLPPDIDEDEIMTAFRRLGPLVVDWPHKSESKSYFPPKGYCFLLFQDELSVQALVDACIMEDGKLYWHVSSPTMQDKPVQIRPWNLADSDYVMDSTQPLDPRKTVFVGGVPRPLRAVELAIIMARLYGGVCYAGIDADPELKYPKGAGRVSFSSQQSYIAAISARFVQLQLGDIDKRVEVKPYVLDDQICDECQGLHSGGKFAPFFCANMMCLQYYCEHCWSVIHSTPSREFHKPLVKEGADRPRAMPYRWC